MVWLSLIGEFDLACVDDLIKNFDPCSAYELQEPSSTFYSPSTRPILVSRLNALTLNVQSELQRQGFAPGRIKVERMLNMRFEGTDTSLMVLPGDEDGDGDEDFEAAFRRVYKAEFGFLLEGQSVSVDDIKVRSDRPLFMPSSYCCRFEESGKHSIVSANPSFRRSPA